MMTTAWAPGATAWLIVRAIGDRIAFTPPLVITEAEIGVLCERFGAGLDAAWAGTRAMAAE